MKKLNYHEFQFDQVPNIPFTERLNQLRAMGRNAENDFHEKYKNLNNWFTADYDQLYLLSFCMRYFLMSEDGYDEEAEKGAYTFPPHYLEILQAMALSHERIYSDRPLVNDVEKLVDDMKEVGRLIQNKTFNLPEDITTEEEFIKYRLRMSVAGYNSVVRNWAYHHQMEKVANDIAFSVRSEFLSVFHADPVEFVKLIFSLCIETEKRVNDHLQKLHSVLTRKNHIEILETYETVFGSGITSVEEKNRAWEMFNRNRDTLRGMLVTHSDLRLNQLFTYSLDELVSLSKNTLSKEVLAILFSKLSYKFEELKDYQQEYIVLDNPVHNRPFIQTDSENYFSALWMTIPHITLLMLENLVAQNETLKNTYNEKRAEYLEDQVEILFKESFPSAQIVRGSQWSHGGRRYENDLLVVIDSFALVVEAKSGVMSTAAKRGAPDRLFKTIKELVENPSEQALRFIEYLKQNKGNHTFTTKGNRWNKIDTTKVNYFIPLGVTFYHFGVIGTNLKQLIDSGLTDKKIHELAPSVSLTDLQIIFDVLSTDVQKVHYLHRRRELETQVQYFGDELDLLAFYLNTGFNLGDKDNEPDFFLNLSLNSKELDPYFHTKNRLGSEMKPRLSMTTWWREILLTLSKSHFPRWLEFSYVLLNMNAEAQQDLEENYNELIKRIRNAQVEKTHNWVSFRTAKEERRFVIVLFPYQNEHRSMRDEMMSGIINSEHEANPQVKGIVVIGVNIDKNHYPYSVVAGHLSVPFFDDQFVLMSSIK